MAESRREAALGAGDEDGREILVWAALYFSCFTRVSLQKLQCKPYLSYVKCNPGFSKKKVFLDQKRLELLGACFVLLFSFFESYI